MLDSDIIYTDPPWNKQAANSFITKANANGKVENFSEFYTAMFGCLSRIRPRVAYCEIGKDHVDEFEAEMGRIFPVVQTWAVVYAAGTKCFLIRGGASPTTHDYHFADSRYTPGKAIENEKARSVGDLCTGMGGTAVAAHTYGATFYGTELNKRRLAVTISKLHKIGVDYVPIPKVQ
jgi:hypothetical protein